MNNNLRQVDLVSTTKGLLNLHQFWNKPIVVFNSASFCGFTNQLSAFEELHKTGKVIPIALPTNEFGAQEPGHSLEINQHYCKKYNVTYPIMDKTDLEHKFFKTFGIPDWNFNKWLFDSKHNFVKKFNSRTQPMKMLEYV